VFKEMPRKADAPCTSRKSAARVLALFALLVIYNPLWKAFIDGNKPSKLNKLLRSLKSMGSSAGMERDGINWVIIC
jgi:hypothetical protein